MDDQLVWIEKEKQNMERVLERLVNQNSHSHNKKGLDTLFKQLREIFSRLAPEKTETLSFPNGQGLHLTMRQEAPYLIYFGGHYDTVFPQASSFQSYHRLDPERAKGPGTTDMKGGLIIMLYALLAFEQHPLSQRIGWHLFLNPDEEIGSIYSYETVHDLAQLCDLALIFEPKMEGGAYVSARKGSANYRILSKGKAAHVGRAPHEGSCAIVPLATFIVEANSIGERAKDLTLHIGLIEGGTASNVVAESSSCSLNLRFQSEEIFEAVEKELFSQAHDLDIELTRLSYRPPKPFNEKTRALFKQFTRAAQQLSQPFNYCETGGVCDGNITAQAGVPTIDTLGACGRGLHTEDETIEIHSLVTGAQLVYQFLINLARSLP